MSGGTTLYTLEGPFWELGPKKQNNPAFFLPLAFGSPVESPTQLHLSPPMPWNGREK